MKTDFDKTIGNINVMPQDIGRVILNLINNAFYAVSEKKKRKVKWIRTGGSCFYSKTCDKIEIKVSDNGKWHSAKHH